MTDALERLARAHCIALEHHDIWGTVRRVQDRTLRALLRAMHVDADSDAEVESAWQRCEHARWREPIAPMTVVRSKASPWRIRVHLPQRSAEARLEWRVVSEDGHVQERSIDRARVAVREHVDLDGDRRHAVDIDLAIDLGPGYHRMTLIADDEWVAEGALAVAPPACYRPVHLASGGRSWGAAVQLYGLRSERNWGIGDFTDLARFVAQWGAFGAGVVGVNPLHALYPSRPAHASPYSPSSRLFHNVLYLDVEAIPEFDDSASARARVASASFQALLRALRAATLVDYAGVAAAKLEVLELVHADARVATTAKAKDRRARFERFKAKSGEALRLHACFDALQEHLQRADAAVWGWPAWPDAFRDPGSAAVARFADEHSERIDFFAWLQWQADAQLAVAGAQARAAALDVGLYADLAVSIDRGGAEAWANQELYAADASVGAPPDDFNIDGQDWGLPPMIPEKLCAAGFAPFITVLRANMREAGALRIDHVMGLQRLYWVPAGAPASEGAYIHYPFEALIGLLALESHRHRCLVIGEDLGTVSDDVREALARNDVLSYRVLLFARDANGEFVPPQAYPEPALATATTHDLPTLAGWWEGEDLRLHASLGGSATSASIDREHAERVLERGQLLAALARAGVLPDEASSDPREVPSLTPALADAVQRYLAQTPSALMVVQPDDVFGVLQQVNVPGTTDAHPNWRRKLPVQVEHHGADRRLQALASLLRDERPRAPPSREAPPGRGASAVRLRHRRARPNVPLALEAIPRSTYRVQFHREFTFDDATALVPYLATLGVSHLYCSPYLKARPGSRHGYDVVDHNALNPELGGAAGFDRMVETLARHGMSHICDVVPNHMAVMGADNGWWMDVLENGPSSAYADFFDIDWTPADASLRNKILVPVLGQPYGTVLGRGELRLAFEADSGGFAVRYFEHRFPLDPREYAQVIDAALLQSPYAAGQAHGAKLRALGEALRALPSCGEREAARVAQRRKAAPQLKAKLAALARDHPDLAEAIARGVEQLNGSASVAASHDPLHTLLDAQPFRLAFWRVASDEINYRRFFDINDLAALRMENDAVFDATHGLVLELAAQGRIGGLRIDHPDGLFDPARYFERLQARYRELATRHGSVVADAGIYVVLEKISASHEHLPRDWAAHGDTGYPFANAMNAVLIDPTARTRVERIWRTFVGDEARDFETAAREGKQAIIAGTLAAGLTTLAGHALDIARDDWHTRDFTFSTLRHALAETVAWFPVYRTYVRASGASEQDRRYIDWAVSRARRTSAVGDAGTYDFIRALLLGVPPAGTLPQLAARYVDFAMRFQQYTAPVAAKGVEDTAFYTHTRLVSLNDVGGDPSQFGMTRRAFHRVMRERSLYWPSTMLATSTHDNKRSEDVRARVDVISERAADWRIAVRRWSRMNRLHKRDVDGLPAPSRSDEYLLYQTLVGSFPADEPDATALAAYRERIEGYMVKAAREAKRRTSWVAVNEAYETALRSFVGALLVPHRDNPFLGDLERLVPIFAWFGLLNSLSMTLVKLTAPGMPDIYQGNEMVEPGLVDPDNRRPVDFALRRATLGALRDLLDAPQQCIAAAVRQWFETPHDGRAKLWLVYRALEFRNRSAALVAEGDYLPLAASGAHARHVLAFARRHRDQVMIVVAGRLFASLGLEARTLPLGDALWADAALDARFLPDGTSLTNQLTNDALVVAEGRLPLSAIFAAFPGALLSGSLAP